MVWNVYREDINSKKIESFNIFNHGRFTEDVKKLLKKNITIDEFEVELRRLVQYYYWSKAEFEIILTSWPAYIDKKELDRLNAEYEDYNTKYGHYPYKINVSLDVGEKIDIYRQVMLNWEHFLQYVWSHKLKE